MFLLKRFAILIVSSVLLSSCLGKYVETDLDALAKNEEIKIVEYGQTNSLTLTKNASTGIYYNISKTNSAGLAVSSAYDLLLAYSLKTIDGKEIIKADSAMFNFYTSQAFDGFKYALLLLKEGEKGTFLIPSYQAYYESPPAGVEKYAVIVAEIELLDLLSEDDKINNYVKKKSITVTEKTNTGLRFIRTSATTTNDSLKTGDNVSVKYNGMFLSETSFDSGSFSVVIGSNSTIAGFSEGISKLKKGEKAKIILPSTIGYGSKGSGSIPPFTPLIFDIEILTVNGK
ncbi:FKBP-type peptidyl-prolyl cis-trans isomerase domain containing protein [Spirosomataceae bacterium]|jgi:FKBP-type peptidyl-prolyl cis-trans isomerase